MWQKSHPSTSGERILTSPASPTILVVDAQASRADDLVRLLNAQGYASLVATSAAAGLHVLAEHAIAAVLVPWPQAELDPDAYTMLAAPANVLVLLSEGQASLPALSDNLLYCAYDDLPSFLTLLRRLYQSEQSLAAARQRLYLGARSTLLGDLIAGIAHDLNNPLTAILGNAELLPEQPSAEDQHGVQQIISSAHRAQRIVQNLLVIARSRPGQYQWIDSTALLQGTLDLLLATLRSHNIRIEVDLKPGLPYIYGEAGQLQQALLHLFQNAIYAVEHQPEKLLALRAFRDDTDEYLVVELSDSGPGIPAALSHRVGEPFFSTRPPGHGAGVGLTITRQIVQRVGGTLELFTPPGKGAGFRIRLPLRVNQLIPDASAEHN